MPQVLYRKWRPHHWGQVVGQDHVVQTLRNAVASGRIAHAYLFAGPRGTGKTTVARLLAKAANCLNSDASSRPCDQCEHCQAVNQNRFLDLIEIDAASNTSVEDVRDLRDKINFSPNQGQYKVYIVDEVHMLSTAAFNALLKTLEEPPPHAIFILATTEVHKVPATVLSRCQRHEFRRIPVADIVAKLKVLVESEGIQVEPEVLTLVARQATGAMRDAESLLDLLASLGKPINLQLAQDVLGTATQQSVMEVVEAMQLQDSASGLGVIHRALDSGSDPRQYARQVVDYLRDLLLVRMGNADQVDAVPELRPQMARHAQAFDVETLLRLIGTFNRAAGEARSSWQPALPLEMAFIEALVGRPSKPVAEVAPKTGAAATETQGPVSTSKKPARVAAPPEELPAEMGKSVEDASSDEGVSRKLSENWEQILNLVKQRNPNLYGLLNSTRSRLLKNNILTLGFATEVLKSKMERDNHLEIVQEVVNQVMEMDITVRCQTVAGQRTTPPPEVDSDGMVASALRDLGGEIVDVQ